MHREATLAVAESGRCIRAFLFLLHVDILWVPSQHEQRDGAYPNASVKASEACCVVIRSIEEAAVGTGQEAITREGKRCFASNDLNTNGLPIIRQIAAQLVGTTDHRKVVVRERPSFEVHHSFLGYSILPVMNFSLVR